MPELMERLFSPFLSPRRFWQDLWDTNDWASYGVDIREDKDHLYVEADLPGFQKEEVEVSLQNGILTISAQHQEEPKEEGKDKEDYLLRERYYESFSRSFTLPQAVDEENVTAKLENGCLTITLNKTPEAKGKKIQVT